MRTRRSSLRLGLIGAVAALGFAGCAAGSPQTGAKAFLREHAAAAARLAASTKTVEGELARLSSSSSRAQLALLADAAAETHSQLVRASEWSVAGEGEEGAEEEDVPRAETQVVAAATELAGVTAGLKRYARAASASALAGYESKLSTARGQWNEGISQLWYLAHTKDPPTL